MKIRNKKTGEILEDVKYIDTSLKTIEIHYLDNGISRMETEKDYHSFLQNWEDYEPPKEPLIKDEKIRKAVKAWADVLGVERATYSGIDGEFYSGVNYIRLGQVNGLEPLGSDTYTIAELCGEDEE